MRTTMERRGAWLWGAAVVMAMAAAMPAGALPLVMGDPFFTPDMNNAGFVGEMINPETDTLLRAAVAFQVRQGQLSVFLHNQSNSPVSANSDLLHGVFFNAGNNPSLTPLSATATHGLVDRDGGSNRDDNRLIPGSAGADVGGNYAYQADLDMSWVIGARGADQGIAGVGYDLGRDDFAGATPFPGEEGSFPAFPLQYGIVPELGEDNYWGDARENLPLVQQPVVYRQMLFTFDIMGDTDFDARRIHDVGFAYGTDLDVIPEPATLTLLGVGLVGLGVRRYRRRG